MKRPRGAARDVRDSRDSRHASCFRARVAAESARSNRCGRIGCRRLGAGVSRAPAGRDCSSRPAACRWKNVTSGLAVRSPELGSGPLPDGPVAARPIGPAVAWFYVAGGAVALAGFAAGPDRLQLPLMLLLLVT